MTWLVILLLCLGRTRAQFPGISNQSESKLEEVLLKLLLSLQEDDYFDTLLIYGRDCIFHSVTKYLEVSTVLVSNGSTIYDWDFGSLTMILSCDPEADQEYTPRTLMKLQRNRRLIYITKDNQPKSVCSSYFQREQYNIALVREDFQNSQVIYACRFFQDPNFARINSSKSHPIYIEIFQNMNKRPIKTMADLLAPRSMLYVDKNTGESKLMGYVANLISNFAQRLNATLQLEVLKNETNFHRILEKVLSDQLDLGITMHTSLHKTPLDTASYPFMVTTYCLMLQIPAKLPFNEVYEMIVDPLVLTIILLLFCILSVLLIYGRNRSWQDLSLANVLLNDVSLRGLLGQSFPFPLNSNRHLKLVFIILCFASVLMTTMYDAYLQSFFTNPPSGPHVHTYKDLGRFNQKLAITAIEVQILKNLNNSHFNEVKQDDLAVFDDWQEFIRLRNNFNLNYSFIVTGDRWTSYAEQQKIFKKPLFYLSNDLCFTRMLFLSIPVRRYLPYRHLFEDHILRQNEFGLVRYWRAHSFFDMVRLGITPLEDLSHPKPSEKSIIMEDVSRILLFYLAGMVMSIFCFLLELAVAKWSREKGM
ncbi:uncharacterized protein [Drosophila kikkawai]|uniref:Uncharacterized protein n=1 Tax=Drosophila kikkawai TaxID=30033 RepID=A0A6P4IU66_DROKI